VAQFAHPDAVGGGGGGGKQKGGGGKSRRHFDSLLAAPERGWLISGGRDGKVHENPRFTPLFLPFPPCFFARRSLLCTP